MNTSYVVLFSPLFCFVIVTHSTFIIVIITHSTFIIDIITHRCGLAVVVLIFGVFFSFFTSE